MRINLTSKTIVDIPAPPAAVFDLLIEERTYPEPRTTDGVTWQAEDEGPVRLGYRSRCHHDHRGDICGSVVTITEFRAPHLLEERIEHRCNHVGRSQRLRQRFELVEDADGTLVTLLHTKPQPVIRALVWKVFPSLRGDQSDALRMEIFRRRVIERASAATVS